MRSKISEIVSKSSASPEKSSPDDTGDHACVDAAPPLTEQSFSVRPSRRCITADLDPQPLKIDQRIERRKEMKAKKT